MVKSKFLYIFLLSFYFFGSALSQQSNPFEIKTRKNSVNIQQKSNENNVFNLDSRKQQEVQNNEIDTTNPFELHNKTPKANSLDQALSQKINKKNQSSPISYINSDKNQTDSNFLLWIFLFILVFLAILLSFNRGLILNIFKAIWFYNLTNSLFRNFGNRDLIFYILLFLNFIINFAIFIYLIANKFHHLSGLNFFMITAGIVLSIYTFKHLAIYLFNSVFTSLKSITTFNFTILLFNISLGILLLPINLIAGYSISPIAIFFIYFGGFIVFSMYLLRLFRGFLITLNYFNISIFHFFLYLCAFEIIPLLFLYRFFVNFL